jgi:hypothetical protein
MRKAQRMREAVPLHDCMGNFLQFVSSARGLDLIGNGLARAVSDTRYGRVRVIRYQETEGATASGSQSSAPMIRVSEAQAVAGLMGRSRTARLPEFDTLGRDSKRAREMAKDPARPVEDFVEQSQNKIKMWPVVPLWNPKHVAWGQA